MRPASEIADEICGCANREQHRRDIALIHRDREELVREIAAFIQTRWPSDQARWLADEIERKYLIGDNTND